MNTNTPRGNRSELFTFIWRFCLIATVILTGYKLIFDAQIDWLFVFAPVLLYVGFILAMLLLGVAAFALAMLGLIVKEAYNFIRRK